jgi:hypothetical protein
MCRSWFFVLPAVCLAGWLDQSRAQTAATAPPPVRDSRLTLNTDPHLVGWWKFDDVTGKSAADAAKPAHPGVLEGVLSFDTHSVPGRIGQALKLEGNNDGVRIAGYKGVLGTQPRTVAAWIKTLTASGDIVSWGTNDFGRMWTFGFVRGHVGVTPKGGYLYMKAGTQDNTWHHVAVVVQEAAAPNLHDHAKLFKDGEPAEIDDIGLLDLWPIDTGAHLDATVGRRFKGVIDDLRIYDRALSEDEVGALFKLDSNRPLTQPQ